MGSECVVDTRVVAIAGTTAVEALKADIETSWIILEGGKGKLWSVTG